MKITSKTWGSRWLIHQDSTHTTNVLMLKAGRRCSWHSHQTKWNLFVVLSGLVGIVTFKGEVLLHAGEEMRVPPGEMHEFRVYKDGAMVEIMYVEYDDDDIERESLGSLLTAKQLEFGKENG